MTRRALAGLALCAAILAATYPLLFGLEAAPGQVFYGADTASVTAVGDTRLNDSLAASLAAQPWARTTSPEVYAFSAWSGTPVVVRGVDADAFLALEGASLIQGTAPASFVLVGERFAHRQNVDVAAPGVLAGSAAPAIEPVAVTGIVAAAGPPGDEVLVPLPLARKLAGLAADELGAVRVRTSDPDALVAFLRGTGGAFAVAGAAGTTFVNAPPGSSEGARLASLLFLYPELREALGRAYIATFAQQGANGVRVVVLGFLVLLTLLAAAGIYAVVWRATAEADRGLGVLRVLGARPATVLGLLLKEFAGYGALAIFVGAAIGFVLAYATGAFGALVLFTYEIRPALDPVTLAAPVLVALAATLLAAVVRGLATLRRAPRDLIAGVPPRAEPAAEEVLPL